MPEHYFSIDTTALMVSITATISSICTRCWTSSSCSQREMAQQRKLIQEARWAACEGCFFSIEKRGIPQASKPNRILPMLQNILIDIENAPFVFHLFGYFLYIGIIQESFYGKKEIFLKIIVFQRKSVRMDAFYMISNVVSFCFREWGLFSIFFILMRFRDPMNFSRKRIRLSKPWISATTSPFSIFFTHPVNSSRFASCSNSKRKPTCCTLPEKVI